VGKLTDAETAELAALAGAGMPQKALAARYGVSPSHVPRIVAGERRGAADSDEPGAVAVALDVFLAELEPDGVGWFMPRRRGRWRSRSTRAGRVLRSRQRRRCRGSSCSFKRS
jgi:DNA-binding transcriptional regulator YdaS (Cro superfamily)